MAAALDEPAVELHDLGRDYGERAALRDVSITVPAGATLAVLGPNGAGKSTLLRPHRGRVRVLGRDVPAEGWAVRARLGLLAHEPLLYRDLSGRENLRYQARLFGIDGSRAEELLERTGMTRRADEPLRTLSRGMVQRLAVCRVVLHDPALLLLDEPLANLDPAAVDAVEPLIGRGAGRTRVVTGHDPVAALRDADLVLGLRGGRAAIAGAAADVTQDDVRALYR